MALIVIVLTCFAIYFFPDSLLDRLSFKSVIPKISRPKSLVTKGNETWRWIQSAQGMWPEYKFYGHFLADMQKLIRLYGGSPKSIVEALKRPLLQDIRFETKLSDIRLGGIVQFVAMSLLTWAFVILSRVILGRSFEMSSLGIIALLQALGLIAFIAIEKYKRQKLFMGFDLAFEVLVTLMALIPIGISLKEKQEKSGVDRFLSCKKLGPDIERVRQSFHDALVQWKDFGKPIEKTLNELLDDIRFAQEMAQTKLLKQMDGFKFLIAAVFFLPAYLFDLYLMVNSFFSLN